MQSGRLPVVPQDFVRPIARHMIEAITCIYQWHIRLLGIGHDKGVPKPSKDLGELGACAWSRLHSNAQHSLFCVQCW